MILYLVSGPCHDLIRIGSPLLVNLNIFKSRPRSNLAASIEIFHKYFLFRLIILHTDQHCSTRTSLSLTKPLKCLNCSESNLLFWSSNISQSQFLCQNVSFKSFYAIRFMFFDIQEFTHPFGQCCATQKNFGCLFCVMFWHKNFRGVFFVLCFFVFFLCFFVFFMSRHFCVAHHWLEASFGANE